MKPNKTPLVSVIIPTYNRAYILKNAIESVLSQDIDLELIVVDDASTDETPELVKKYPLVYIKHSFRRGPASARNTGLRHARGEYIAFLDSDDVFLPGKLKKQLEFFEKNPEFSLVQTEELWFKGDRLIKPKKIHKKAEGWFFHRAVKLCVVSISTVMIKKEVFKKVGIFDEAFPVCEDYEFWLRVSLFYPMGLINEPLVSKSGGRPDQLSATKGLDFYRVKALIKLFKNYNTILTPEMKLILFKEAKKKYEIFYKGALKHGNLKQAFELKKMFKATFSHSVLTPYGEV
ncbi:MAG: glycosyltransferase [Thermodesulfobacteria bacterium]|nr:glycosyltransferase [Thermodesulfobacteriota bacterium]